MTCGMNTATVCSNRATSDMVLGASVPKHSLFHMSLLFIVDTMQPTGQLVLLGYLLCRMNSIA